MIAPPRRETIAQALRFAVTGIANTALDIAIFAALVHAAHLRPEIANVISYSAGTLFSFVANSLWTFRAGLGAGAWRRFAVFCAIGLSALVLSTALISHLVHFVTPVIAKLLSVPVTFVWGFVLNRIFVFRT